MKKLLYDYNGRCGYCHAYIAPKARFCTFCGTPKGKGEFRPFLNIGMTLYGPPIIERFFCPVCGKKCEEFMFLPERDSEPLYCSRCGSSLEKLAEYIGWDSIDIRHSKESSKYYVHVQTMNLEEREKLASILMLYGYARTYRIGLEKVFPNACIEYCVDVWGKILLYGYKECSPLTSSRYNGRRIYSLTEFQKLLEFIYTERPRYPVFHIPHDGAEFSEELMESVCVPRMKFLQYHEEMRDRYVSDVIPPEYNSAHNIVKFDISRLLCDVERFLDSEEVMNQYGMGFCYERAYDGTRIKNVTEDLKKKTLKYYQKHHSLVDRLCGRHSRILFIDLHSFSDEIVMKDFLRPDMDTPDVCIGTEPDYTPPALVEIVRKQFEEAGYTTAINYPYEGCFIPDAVMKKKIDCDCAAVMIEINRRIFSADPDSGTVSKMREIIGQIVKEVVWI